MEESYQIDQSLPVQERIQAFLQATEDPYHLNVNGMSVEVRYRAQGPTLQQKMSQICQD